MACARRATSSPARRWRWKKGAWCCATGNKNWKSAVISAPKRASSSRRSWKRRSLGEELNEGKQARLSRGESGGNSGRGHRGRDRRGRGARGGLVLPEPGLEDGRDHRLAASG